MRKIAAITFFVIIMFVIFPYWHSNFYRPNHCNPNICSKQKIDSKSNIPKRSDGDKDFVFGTLSTNDGKIKFDNYHYNIGNGFYVDKKGNTKIGNGSLLIDPDKGTIEFGF